MIRVVCQCCGACLATLETVLDDPCLGISAPFFGSPEPYLFAEPADDVVRVAVRCGDCLALSRGGGRIWYN